MSHARFKPQDLADRWHVSPATLERWRTEGKGPPYIKLEGRVLYREEDIDDYERDHLHRSPAERVPTGS